MHADQHVLLSRDLTADERHVLGAVEERLEHVAGEVAVDRGDARFGDAPHQLLAPAAEADQIGDRDHDEIVFRREDLEVRSNVPSCRRR